MSKKWREVIRKIIFVIALIVFIWSAYELFTIFNEYRKNASSYKDIEQYAPQVVENNDNNPKDKEDVKAYVFKEEDYNKLYEINNEFKGWIMIPGTKVNYPVLQGEDNDYYLTHNFKKEYNAGGGIFISCDNPDPFNEKNTIIHGHYMKDKSMFGSLHSYKDGEFAKLNNKFYITTKDGTLEYEIFSIYIEQANTNPYRFNFSSDEEYVKYLNELKNKSMHKLVDYELTGRDKIVTLSTCSYEQENNRLLIHGKLINK